MSKPAAINDRVYARRRVEILVFCAVAYVLHILAIWGIACFHEVHVGAELKPWYRFVVDTYGTIGLLGIATLFAMIPTVAFLLLGWSLARSVRSKWSWEVICLSAKASLIGTLVADIALGLPVFTTS